MSTGPHPLAFRRPRKWWGLSAFYRLLVRMTAVISLSFALHYALAEDLHSRVIDSTVPYHRRVVYLDSGTIPLDRAVESLSVGPPGPLHERFIAFFLERIHYDLVFWGIVLAGICAVVFEVLHKTDVLGAVTDW